MLDLKKPRFSLEDFALASQRTRNTWLKSCIIQTLEALGATHTEMEAVLTYGLRPKEPQPKAGPLNDVK